MKNPIRNRNSIQIIIAYFLIYVVWGSTYYFIGYVMKEIPPFLLGAIRFSAAGLILLTWCYFRGDDVFNQTLIKRSAVSGLILLFIDMAVIMLAQRYVTSSLVAIIASSITIWILLLDFPMWKKNFRNPFTLAGIIIGFLGVLMLYLEQYLSEEIEDIHNTGIYILIFGCISWALGTLYTKYFSVREATDNSFAGSAWQMLFASAMFWIFSFATGDIKKADVGDNSISSWASLLYLIFFGSILAYTAYIWLLKIRPAAEVATHAYVNPVIAIIIGVSLGNELVTRIQIAGLVLILVSVTLIRIRFKKKMLISK
ncbi:EamA family transporter [Maribellus maritimus]|uniref:EamA family transporter n=1 Tax=Maribellus maritimus TaxID=2870838 RepID=UPI001EEB26B5|nr:EamA family transporter [Maribellus maritimus]MCG6189507.1 EamA family transporter [Maribellus maritimus]